MTFDDIENHFIYSSINQIS